MRDLRFQLRPRYQTSRALIIGIDQYQHTSPLSYAVSDAEAIRDLLVSDLEFSEKNIVFLKDSTATRQNILNSFSSFSDDEVDLDDRILIFFAGHGHTKRSNRGEVGYLVAYDTDLDNPSSLVRWDDLTRNADFIRAKHILFIMDACYGGLALTRQVKSGSARFLRDMLMRFSLQVLTAGKADELVADSGGPLANHSVFTGHLIQGLQGAAATDQGVITANGLMTYVYNKVATDKNSNQTPHYGSIDGDGDFIISAPNLFGPTESANKGEDELLVVPFTLEEQADDSLQSKVTIVKRLLSTDSHTIELHDFMMNEVTRFLSDTSEDHFTVQGSFSTDELLSRISKYEAAVTDLAVLIACIAYWGKDSHKHILQKSLTRTTDRLEMRGGLTAWLNLRTYPLLLEIYYAGIAAVEAQRYDSLAHIFLAKVAASDRNYRETNFVQLVTHGTLELNRQNIFKYLPGREKHYTPLSEYLFTLLQPKLDDALFFGKSYEESFDEFEVFLALVIGDYYIQKKNYFWAPIGRFGWKSQHNTSPLMKLVSDAQAEGENWAPLKAGLFGGDSKRFVVATEQLTLFISKLNWW